MSARKKTVDIRIHVGNTENSIGSFTAIASRMVINADANANEMNRSSMNVGNGITNITIDNMTITGKKKSLLVRSRPSIWLRSIASMYGTTGRDKYHPPGLNQIQSHYNPSNRNKNYLCHPGCHQSFSNRNTAECHIIIKLLTMSHSFLFI